MGQEERRGSKIFSDKLGPFPYVAKHLKAPFQLRHALRFFFGEREPRQERNRLNEHERRGNNKEIRYLVFGELFCLLKVLQEALRNLRKRDVVDVELALFHQIQQEIQGTGKSSGRDGELFIHTPLSKEKTPLFGREALMRHHVLG